MFEILPDIILYPVAGGLAGLAIGLIIDLLRSFFNSSGESKWVRQAPYTTLVREIILFTNIILVQKGIKHFPSFKIRYYRHKKYSGLYTGEVIVYLENNREIPELVDTVLHEVQHYIQSLTDRQYKHYDRYTAERGYWNNPFEAECREFAAKHRDSCLKHLEDKQLIKRHNMKAAASEPEPAARVITPSQWVNAGWSLIAFTGVMAAVYTGYWIFAAPVIWWLWKFAVIECWQFRFADEADTVAERKGVFSVRIVEINWFRVKSVQVRKPFLMRLVGISIVDVISSEPFSPYLCLYGIRNGDQWAKYIREMATYHRNQKGVRETDFHHF
jgi:membrane protein YdbS with pleckstrin-like domain